MRKVSRSALVPYRAEQMYALVADVRAYPEFLPWCTGAEVHSQTADELRASIGMGLGVLNTSFATRNELDPPRAMTMLLEEGPFRSLEGRWVFDELGESGCEVHLDVEFEFESRATDLLFGTGFEKICNDLIDAFVKRANDLYGNG